MAIAVSLLTAMSKSNNLNLVLKRVEFLHSSHIHFGFVGVISEIGCKVKDVFHCEVELLCSVRIRSC